MIKLLVAASTNPSMETACCFHNVDFPVLNYVGMISTCKNLHSKAEAGVKYPHVVFIRKDFLQKCTSDTKIRMCSRLRAQWASLCKSCDMLRDHHKVKKQHVVTGSTCAVVVFYNAASVAILKM